MEGTNNSNDSPGANNEQCTNGGSCALKEHNTLRQSGGRHNCDSKKILDIDFLNFNNNTNSNSATDSQDEDKLNGLLPKIWGPHTWKALHCITFGYPIKPTPFEKKNFRTFFEALGFVLPCEACRESYRKLIVTGSNKLTDEALESRDTLTLWLYNLHQSVNSKLGVNYDVSYSDVVETYESFRVKCDPSHKGCIMPIEQRKISYCNEYKKEYPIIPYSIIKCFAKYAELRGITTFMDQVDKTQFVINNKDVNEQYENEWDERNKNCDEIIKYMRQEGIYSLEQDGDYKGLPTTNELFLFSYMTSNMNLNEIKKSAELIGFNIKKTYKFTK